MAYSTKNTYWERAVEYIDSAEDWYRQGNYDMAIHEYRKALQEYNSATPKDERRSQVLRNIGYCYDRLGDSNSAKQYYQQADFVESQ